MARLVVLLGALLLWSTSFLLSVPASAATAVPTPPPIPPAAAAATSTPADPNAVKTATTDPGDTVPGTDPLPTPGQPERGDQSCFLILDKLEPGESTSDVVASGCAPRGSPAPAVPEATSEPAPSSAPSSTEQPSGEQPPAGQPSTEQPTTPPSSKTPVPRFSNDRTYGPARAAAPAVAASSVPLVELYENTNYGGRSFIVYGNAGPCDASGYSISDSSTPNSTVGGVSSYKAYSNCLAQNLFNRTQYTGTNTVFNGLNQPLVGAAYDNSVLSMKLTSQNNCTTYTQTGGSVCGAVRNKYNQLGGPATLGYPTTNEVTNPDGTGKRTVFQIPNTAIYFSPPTGANQVQGLIYQDWAGLGFETGTLGYPTTDELTNPDGVGKRNSFAKSGAIYYSPSTGAHQLSGPILQSWGQWGYEKSPVGYPLSDEVDNSSTPYASYGSRRNDFQMGGLYSNNGTVSRGRWTATTGSGTASTATPGPSRMAGATTAVEASRAAPAVNDVVTQAAGAGCPAGTTNYPAPKQIFNCLVVVTDTTGYGAGIRAGFSNHNGNPNPPQDDNAHVTGPFGSAHAADDHNVNFRNQQLVIQDAVPYRDMNAPDFLRYLYTMTFQIEGNPTNSINVVVQKQPDVDFVAPDGYDMGLITGYCSRGVPNPMNYQGFCPSNLPAPFGNGPGGLPG